MANNRVAIGSSKPIFFLKKVQRLGVYREREAVQSRALDGV
jgi:hypothetical protein